MKRAVVGWSVAAGALLFITAVALSSYNYLSRIQYLGEQLRLGDKALKAGEFDRPISIYSEVLHRALTTHQIAMAQFGRGTAENSKFRFDDSIRDFTEAIRLRPRWIEPYLGRAYAFQTEGRIWQGHC